MLTLFQQPAEKAAVLACAHLAQLLQSSSEDDAGWVQAYAGERVTNMPPPPPKHTHKPRIHAAAAA